MNRTLQELINFSQRAGWSDLSSAGLELLAVRINSTIQLLVGMRPWPDYLSHVPGSLQLKAPYATGICVVDEGSATVTGSGTTWTTGMAGQEFLGPDGRPYTIAAWVSATELTLSEPYIGDSKAVGDAAGYSIRYVRYAMPADCLRVGRMKHRTCGWMNDGRDVADFFGLRLLVHQESQAPDTVWKRRPYFYVNPSPSAAEQIHFPYWRKPARLSLPSDETDWPQELDWLLYAALGLTVREKSEQDAAAALYQPAFQAYANTAFRQADASAEPQKLIVGRSDGGETLSEFQARFQIEPDVEV